MVLQIWIRIHICLYKTCSSSILQKNKKTEIEHTPKQFSLLSHKMFHIRLMILSVLSSMIGRTAVRLLPLDFKLSYDLYR